MIESSESHLRGIENAQEQQHLIAASAIGQTLVRPDKTTASNASNHIFSDCVVLHLRDPRTSNGMERIRALIAPHQSSTDEKLIVVRASSINHPIDSTDDDIRAVIAIHPGSST